MYAPTMFPFPTNKHYGWSMYGRSTQFRGHILSILDAVFVAFDEQDKIYYSEQEYG
jgi:hypothetical protein